MDLILRQIEGLIVGSVPTIIFFILLVAAYAVLVRRPLDKVLEERRARTSGALEQAKGAMGAAEAETAVFEDKLRSAKAEIFEARDRKLKGWAAEREQALMEARAATQQRIGAARREIEDSGMLARTQIESMSGELSAQIMRAVLPSGMPGTEASQ